MPAAETVEGLRAQLIEEIDRRRDRDRELVERRARADAVEAELGNVRLTLAFGLGHALVEALHWRGLLRLPGRIVELRRRQAAKRGRLPGRYKGVRPADAMQLVDGAVARAQGEGIVVARDWVAAQKAGAAEKARALVEAALAMLPADADGALALGQAAIALKPGEPRLFSLALALHAAGGLTGPLALIDAAGDHLPRSAAMDAAIAAIRAESGRSVPDIAARAAVPSPGEAIVATAAAQSIVARDLDGRRAELIGTTVVPVDSVTVEGLREAKAGVLHLCGLGDAAAVAAISAAHRAGIAVVLDLQALPPQALVGEGGERGRLAAMQVAAACRAVERVVARSEAVRMALSRIVPDLSVTLVPAEMVAAAPLPEADLVDLRRELDLRPDRPVIICPVALEDDPGLFDLIAALVPLAADVPEATLLFVGTGAAAPALARQAARLGVGRNVLFSGSTVAADLPAQLALGRVAVFPRRGAAVSEDCSPAMLNAAGIGLPIVASRQESSWHGVGGVAPHEADDAASLAIALAEALRTVRSVPHPTGEEAAALGRIFDAVQQEIGSVAP